MPIQKRFIFMFIPLNLHCRKKFSIQDFFSKGDQICSFLRIWSHLRKKSLMKNFIFCAVLITPETQPGSTQTSQMESFATRVNDFYLLTIVAKFFILDICRGPSYASVSRVSVNIIKPAQRSAPFLYLLKTSENLWFSDVFKG